jgi:ESCRT-I complex subunit TSG101
MTIKSNHRHVDMQGVVYLPYLHEWNPLNPSTSNLVGLVEICSSVFSIEPPLFSKAAGSASHTTATTVTATPTATATAITTGSVVSSGTAAATGSSAYGVTAYGFNNNSAFTASNKGVAGGNNNSSSSSSGSSSSAVIANKPVPAPGAVSAVAFKPSNNSNSGSNSNQTALNNKIKLEGLQDKVNLALHSKIYELHTKYNAELSMEFENERLLEVSKSQAQQYVEVVTAAIADMNRALQEIEAKTVAVLQWQSEERVKEKSDVEQVLQPYDQVSAQIVRLNAEINAIDDAIYFLERALVSTKIDLTGFLREVRQLSRQQFMSRAHLAKIQNSLAANVSVAATVPVPQQLSPSAATGFMLPNAPTHLPQQIAMPSASVSMNMQQQAYPAMF